MLKIFIILFFFIDIISKQIILDLKYYKKFSNEFSFENNIILNDLITDVFIGSNYQKLTFSVRTNEYSTLLIGNNCEILYPELQIKYNQELSKDFKQITHEIIYGEESYIKACISNDKFSLFKNDENNKNKNILINKNNKMEFYINFLLVSRIRVNNFFSYSEKLPPSHSGIIGLNICPMYDTVQGTGLIENLKKNNIIDNYAFSFIFNKDKFNLILGYEYNINDLKNYKFRRTEIIEKYSSLDWAILFDSIYYDNIEINHIKGSRFIIEMGVVVADDKFKDLLVQNFFGKYINKSICFLNKLSDNYTEYIFCKNKINIKNFKSIIFYMKDINFSFELNYQDLFIIKNNIVYFLITFQKSKKFWDFGFPIFKKYKLIFDIDKKIIGIHLNNNKLIEKCNILIYLLYILLILLIGIVVYIKFILNKNKIKNKAIELNITYKII